MVLDQPRGVEALPVGEHDLLDAVLVGGAFGDPLAPGVFARPRLGRFDFVEQSEFH
jgi:hypothetical protein